MSRMLETIVSLEVDWANLHRLEQQLLHVVSQLPKRKVEELKITMGRSCRGFYLRLQMMPVDENSKAVSVGPSRETRSMHNSVSAGDETAGNLVQWPGIRDARLPEEEHRTSGRIAETRDNRSMKSSFSLPFVNRKLRKGKGQIVYREAQC